jgi:hypothetical protein
VPLPDIVRTDLEQHLAALEAALETATTDADQAVARHHEATQAAADAVERQETLLDRVNAYRAALATDEQARVEAIDPTLLAQGMLHVAGPVTATIEPVEAPAAGLAYEWVPADGRPVREHHAVTVLRERAEQLRRFLQTATSADPVARQDLREHEIALQRLTTGRPRLGPVPSAERTLELALPRLQTRSALRLHGADARVRAGEISEALAYLRRQPVVTR